MTNGTRKGWGVSVTLRPLFTPGKDPVPIVQEARCARVPVWTDAENFPPPTGIRSPDRPTSRYTDYATPAHPVQKILLKYDTTQENDSS